MSNIIFSPSLTRAIEMEIQSIYSDLGDNMWGAEEIIGDNLVGKDAKEYQSLIQAHTFEAVCAAVKRKFMI